jgi:polar amino acid transport system substrate-binding protein
MHSDEKPYSVHLAPYCFSSQSCLPASGFRRLSLRLCLAVVFCSLVLSAGGVEPQSEILPAPLPTPPLPKQRLIVGLAPGPPFDIQAADGSWTGISVELWRQIANELGLAYDFRETDLSGSFGGLAQGWLDVSVGPLSITAKREEVCDFTHAYFVSSLAVAVPATHVPGSVRFFITFFDPSLWWAIVRIAIGLLAVMAVVAALIWLCERRANPAQFGGGGRPARGFGSALWWSAVTMTTVGYGDVSPQTLKGRVIAVVWMFISLVLVSTFTAAMASILTTERLSQGAAIHGLDDLRQVRIGTFANSSSAQYLEANHIDYQALGREELFEALKKGKIQAVLYDEPFLRYVVRTQYPGQFTVLPLNLDTQLYAFALREGNALREPINRVLLRKIHEPAWRDLLYRYLGRAPG